MAAPVEEPLAGASLVTSLDVAAGGQTLLLGSTGRAGLWDRKTGRWQTS